MQFTRLRLSGFKSFAEPTELPIEPGLTGVVGPNGCGKSNLIEAMRWVMGESSARQMRGAEMDDVIFGGTTGRSGRNFADVALVVDPEGQAPAHFPEAVELEVQRRIERDQGSSYRVNGRDARAKDVQLLFADAATGSHSPAMVGQGRIGALINARPADRRAILEDAAGIAGLHSRRHEAEQRLRGAETNLERLEDVLRTLDQQLQSLRRQARQAARYRTVSEAVRRAEAVVLVLAWAGVVAERTQAGAGLLAAEDGVAQATAAAATASRLQAEQAAALPALREALAVASAELQRVTLARGALEAEAERLAERTRATQAALVDLDRDLDREQALASDAGAALTRLDQEGAELAAAGSAEAEAIAEAARRLSAAEQTVEAKDQALAALSQAIAGADAQRTALERRRVEAEQRRDRLTREQAGLADQQRRLAADPALAVDLAALALAIAEAETQAAAAKAAVETSGRARAAAQGAEGEAGRAAEQLTVRATRLKAESSGLAAALATGLPRGGASPVLDAMRVAPGSEQAVAAALGDDLSAPLARDGREPLRWDPMPDLPDPPALPAGSLPLGDRVEAPPALGRRLSQVGLVPDAATGLALRGRMAVGQRLVTPAGDLFRWDGFTRAAGAPSAAAARLAQRNRLAELEADLRQAETAARAADETRQTARQAFREAETVETRARMTERTAAATLAQARDVLTRAEGARAAAGARLAGLDQALARLTQDQEENAAALGDIAAQQAALPDLATQRGEVTERRADLGEARGHLLTARADHDRLLREAGARRRRLETIASEQAEWRRRVGGADARLEELRRRRAAHAQEAKTLAGEPARLAERRTALEGLIAQADGRRLEAANQLSRGETAQAETDRTTRAADAAASAAREARVRAEAVVTQVARDAAAIAARIAERLDCRPEAAIQVAALEDAVLPDPAAAENEFQRLTRERDAIGPVNLRAEGEMAELEAQIGALTTERDDLTGAIARLRSAITSLSREGRERLLAAFEIVNGHFESLFVRLFGGGRAHLQLTDSADPLGAGLEIIASPPGKRLQTLSLLSGGEQALTALALIFAVFLTNPSPICVLDEVDAPLDDANVDRFCSLLTEIATTTRTRFLVITHHRMTMTRMDRLFGVTMQERGISQLVSVDLSQAERLTEN